MAVANLQPPLAGAISTFLVEGQVQGPDLLFKALI
jgi:hypothetical protein